MEQTQGAGKVSSVGFAGLVFLCGWLLAFPFSLPALIIGFHLGWANLLAVSAIIAVGGALGGVLAARTKKWMPQSFRARYAIAAFPLMLCLFLCALGIMAGRGDLGSIFLLPYGFSQIAFLPAQVYAAITSNDLFQFFFPFMFYVAFLLAFTFFERRRPDAPAVDKRFTLGLSGGLLALLAVLAAAFFIGRRDVLPPNYGFEYGGGYSSVDLWTYDLTDPGNRVPRLSEPSTFTVSDPSLMPVLDGAEAAYPVYSAFALACFENIAALETEARNQKDIQIDQSGGKVVTFTNTIYAYERLLSGEVDIFFGAQPSAAQQQMAKDAGKTLMMVPIGLEAFVFFVSEENPVDALSSDDIRAIYSGKEKNWSAFGGPQTRIYAFQRPENSGSQTIMQKFMGEAPLQTPLQEEYSPGMGGTVRRVAEYRNGADAIGYSFRFFLTGMADSSGVKLLMMDGVSPTPETIASRAYPYTVELYAISLADNTNELIPQFYTWMQSPQGQELVEQVGYVRLPAA